MDFKNIIRMALDEYTDDLHSAVDGLTPAERRFQPTPDSHHVDFVLWHMARVEDNWVQGFGRGVETVWENGGWAARLGLPEQGNGWGYTVRQVEGVAQNSISTCSTSTPRRSAPAPSGSWTGYPRTTLTESPIRGGPKSP